MSDSWIAEDRANELEAEVVNLSEEVVLAKAAIERLTAERDDLQAKLQRVEALRERWRHDQMLTLGKVLPGGVLSISLNSAEYQLGRALDGGESDE